MASALSGSKPPAAMMGPSKMRRRNCAATGPDVAFDARLDDVEVGEVEAVELRGDVAEEGLRVGVGHAVPFA
jgi:hypothetical protein